MPEQAPVIFTLFANPYQDLEHLAKEEKEIQQLLSLLDNAGQIKHVIAHQSDLDHCFKLLNAYKGRIALFHFSGHADSWGIQLQDGRASLPALMDELMRENPAQLKLVFLNGCGTQQHVKQLFQQKVPAVLATTRDDIYDNKAKDFSIQFYQRLCAGDKLHAAVQSARNLIFGDASDGNRAYLSTYAAGKWTGLPNDTFSPWRLFYREAQTAALDYLWPQKPLMQQGPPPPLSNNLLHELDYSHALRPKRTQLLLRELLLQKKALNVYGEKHQGKERLLEDLKACAIPHCRFIKLRIQPSFELTLMALAQDLGLGATKDATLGNLLQQASRQNQDYILLLVEGIDDLYDEAGKALKGYDSFFVQLNGLANSDFCRVLCVTELPQGTQFNQLSSPLAFERRKLPDLRLDEFEQELKRLGIPAEYRSYLVEQCDTEPQLYRLAKELQQDSPTFNTQDDVKRYLKAYRHNIRRGA